MTPPHTIASFANVLASIKTSRRIFSSKKPTNFNVVFLIIMGTESDPKLRLYLRLPVRIDEELQIKELHPDINKVVLPRQKSRRWCVVQFPSVEILQKARKEIKRKKINGRKIIVSSYKQGKKKPKQKKTKANEEAFCIDTKPLLSLLDSN